MMSKKVILSLSAMKNFRLSVVFARNYYLKKVYLSNTILNTLKVEESITGVASATARKDLISHPS